jgi:hypothetical protein
MHDLAAVLQVLLPADTILNASYGWGSGIHPSLENINLEVGVGRLDRFIADSIRQEIILPGDSDFYLIVPKGRVHFVFTHEGTMHSYGIDYELETQVWMSVALSKLPLADCLGVGLINIQLEKEGKPPRAS